MVFYVFEMVFVTCVGWFRYVCRMVLLRVWDGFVTCVGWICYVFGMVLLRVWDGFVE